MLGLYWDTLPNAGGKCEPNSHSFDSKMKFYMQATEQVIETESSECKDMGKRGNICR